MKRILYGIVVLFILLTSFLTSAADFKAYAQYAHGNPYPKFGEKTVTISFPTPNCTSIGHYDRLEIENCSFVTQEGQPMLPVRTVVMKLPEGSSVLNVNVTTKEVLLDGIFSVLPAPSPSIVGSSLPGESDEDATIYASKSFFPEKWYTFREGHGLDADTNTRVKYVTLNLFPLRFLPAEKRVIRAVNVSVKISYVEAVPLTTASLFKNLIITSPDFEPYALQLAQWKNQTGVSSRVVNTTWIYHNYGGIDRQEQIRNCIKDFVANYGILYVTIFGDADVVPVRYAYVPDGQDTYTPTDLYYGDLDGTWDDNNDQLYADQMYDNVDGIPDVYVGRIPVSLASYAQVAVDKIIGYTSQFNASQSWTQRVVLAAGTGSPDGFSNTLGNASTVLNEYISDIVSDKDVVKLYESAGNLSTGSMGNQINNGALFVNFAGHGDPDTGLFSAGWLFYWVIPGLWWNGFGIADVQSLINGLNLPVVTTSSCSTARFDDVDCLGEWFVVEPHGGSIAYFGATRISWTYVDGYSPYGLMGEMDWRIYQNYHEGFTRVGQMWGESISEYVQSHVWNYTYASVYDVKTFMEFELLGDPTIRIYNPDYPETLNVPEDCATIQGAINAAYDGDIILVSSGTYYENLIVGKSVSLIGENRSTTIIDGQFAGNVINITASRVAVSGFTIQRSDNRGVHINSGSTGNNVSTNILTGNVFGIYLDYSSNDNIIGNTITNNGYGIILYSSSNNSVSGNTMTNNSYNGIVLDVSSSNSISGNNITDNGYDGITFYYSTSNSIIGNTITNNSYYGIDLGPSYNNSIIGNNITDNGYDGICLYSPTNDSIIGNNITNNRHGIYLYCYPEIYSSSNNSILGNNITNNSYYGIYLESSDYNSILGNNITNNIFGFYSVYSSNNSIYHNNFIGNAQQAYSNASVNVWDEDYPSGGNYWSDYIGADVKRGHYQNETGSDGIGDSACIIDADEYLSSMDRYPLMKPYAGPHDIGITNITTSKLVVGQNDRLEISLRILNYGISNETVNLTAYSNTTTIATFTNITLQGRNSIDMSFIWNTTGFAYGNYIISAHAWPVPGETEVSDNHLVDGQVLVSVLGDINGDGTVDIFDAIQLANAFGTSTGQTRYNADADLNSSGAVDIFDAILLAGNFNKHVP